VIYVLSFHVFRKRFSKMNFISRTNAATYLKPDCFIPKHFKTASKELNEKLLKNTSLKRKKKSLKILTVSNFLKLTLILPSLNSLKIRRLITGFRVWLQ